MKEMLEPNIEWNELSMEEVIVTSIVGQQVNTTDGSEQGMTGTETNVPANSQEYTEVVYDDGNLPVK